MVTQQPVDNLTEATDRDSHTIMFVAIISSLVGVFLIGVIVVVLLVYRRKHKRQVDKRVDTMYDNSEVDDAIHAYENTPVNNISGSVSDNLDEISYYGNANGLNNLDRGNAKYNNITGFIPIGGDNVNVAANIKPSVTGDMSYPTQWPRHDEAITTEPYQNTVKNRLTQAPPRDNQTNGSSTNYGLGKMYEQYPMNSVRKPPTAHYMQQPSSAPSRPPIVDRRQPYIPTPSHSDNRQHNGPQIPDYNMDFNRTKETDLPVFRDDNNRDKIASIRSYKNTMPNIDSRLHNRVDLPPNNTVNSALAPHPNDVNNSHIPCMTNEKPQYEVPIIPPRDVRRPSKPVCTMDQIYRGKNRANRNSSGSDNMPHYANLSSLNRPKVMTMYEDTGAQYADISVTKSKRPSFHNKRHKHRHHSDAGSTSRPSSFRQDDHVTDLNQNVEKQLVYANGESNEHPTVHRSIKLTPQEVAELYAVPIKAKKNNNNKKSARNDSHKSINNLTYYPDQDMTDSTPTERHAYSVLI